MTISVQLPLDETYIPTAIERILRSGTSPQAFLSNCSTLSCDAVPNTDCTICCSPLDPWDTANSAPFMGTGTHVDDMIITNSICQCSLHTGCFIANLLFCESEVKHKCPICHGNLMVSLQDMADAVEVNEALEEYEIKLHVEPVNVSESKKLVIGAYGFKFDILTAAHFLRRKQLREIPTAPAEGQYAPWGIAAHGDGRAIIEGMLGAVDAMAGEARNVEVLKAQLPARACCAMLAAGDSRVYTAEMTEFAEEVAKIAAHRYFWRHGVGPEQ